MAAKVGVLGVCIAINIKCLTKAILGVLHVIDHFLNNNIKKKLLERANLGHGSLLSGGCIDKQIGC